MSTKASRAPKIKRTSTGEFAPGESGNPDGRPKGSRNKITLLKHSLELQLREQSKDFLPGVLKQAIELALQGDRQMIKLLLDLHMSKGLAEETKAQEKTQIFIGSLPEKDEDAASEAPSSTASPSTEEKTLQ